MRLFSWKHESFVLQVSTHCQPHSGVIESAGFNFMPATPDILTNVESFPWWTSERIDTNLLAVNVALWEDISQDHRALTPEVLSQYIPSYSAFHRYQDGTIYSKDGIPRFAGKVVVGLVAPSATGKDTLLDHILVRHPQDLIKIITTTTREQRLGAHEYNFIDQATFDATHEQNKFIEEIIQGMHLYGTEIAEFLAAYQKDPRIMIWRGDVAGAPRMKKFCELLGIPFMCVGILPGLTYKEMYSRIMTIRGTDPKDEWRYKKALYELEKMPDVADFILMNYPVPGGKGSAVVPTDAIEALGNVVLTTIGKTVTPD